MTTIYNNATQTVNASGVVALTTITNQKGNSTRATTNGISALSSGIYDVYATIVGEITGGGVLSIQPTVNGVVVPYAIGESYTNTNEPATITLVFPIVVNPNCCAITTNLPATIQLINQGTVAETITNATLTVIKR